MGHQDCVQQETPKVASYGIPWAHVDCGTLCGGTEWDSHGHPMRLRTDGNPIAFMDSQWQYWTLLDFNLYNNNHSLLYSHTSFRCIQVCWVSPWPPEPPTSHPLPQSPGDQCPTPCPWCTHIHGTHSEPKCLQFLCRSSGIIIMSMYMLDMLGHTHAHIPHT